MYALREKLASMHAGYQLSRPARLVAKRNSEATFYLYDEIGSDGFGDCISAKTLVSALADCKDCSTLTVRVNSPGGSIFEALAMMANLRDFPGRKVALIDGLCASAATFLVCGGCDEVRTAPESTWMIHDGIALAYGNAAELRKTADLIEQKSADIAAIYARKTSLDNDVLREWMSAETWMTAAEAIERRFADGLSELSDEAAPVLAPQKRLYSNGNLDCRPDTYRNLMNLEYLLNFKKLRINEGVTILSTTHVEIILAVGDHLLITG